MAEALGSKDYEEGFYIGFNFEDDLIFDGDSIVSAVVSESGGAQAILDATRQRIVSPRVYAWVKKNSGTAATYTIKCLGTSALWSETFKREATLEVTT